MIIVLKFYHEHADVKGLMTIFFKSFNKNYSTKYNAGFSFDISGNLLFLAPLMTLEIPHNDDNKLGILHMHERLEHAQDMICHYLMDLEYICSTHLE